MYRLTYLYRLAQLWVLEALWGGVQQLYAGLVGAEVRDDAGASSIWRVPIPGLQRVRSPEFDMEIP